MMIFVTGGAGFIGSNFILHWLKSQNSPVLNFDKLTYAGNLHNLDSVSSNKNYKFIKGDIQDRELIRSLLTDFTPVAIINFAAESHVDRSIHDPSAFIETNIIGTFDLLEESLRYWKNLEGEKRKVFRFLHISTDEVYGSLKTEDPSSTEKSPYAPNSPYSASKASSDHLVRAYHHTYGLPTLTTHSANNFGPYQFPEKLIPLMIINAIKGKPLPIYGDGLNIRNWIYVEDHCDILQLVLSRGIPGETYNIGDETEITNLDLVKTICGELDKIYPNSPHTPHSQLIQSVKDRAGHDRRYSLDFSKISKDLGWKPKGNFVSNIQKTIHWYLNNLSWIDEVLNGDYQKWIGINYSNRGSND
jgi:dTDP-glucose 4,6-dehydratase